MEIGKLTTPQMHEIMNRMSKDVPVMSILYFQRVRAIHQRLIDTWEQKTFGGNNGLKRA